MPRQLWGRSSGRRSARAFRRDFGRFPARAGGGANDNFCRGRDRNWHGSKRRGTLRMRGDVRQRRRRFHPASRVSRPTACPVSRLLADSSQLNVEHWKSGQSSSGFSSTRSLGREPPHLPSDPLPTPSAIIRVECAAAQWPLSRDIRRSAEASTPTLRASDSWFRNASSHRTGYRPRFTVHGSRFTAPSLHP